MSSYGFGDDTSALTMQQQAAGLLAFSTVYQQMLSISNVVDDLDNKLGTTYDKGTHGAVPEEQKAAYVERARQLGVLDYLQQRFAFSGTPDEVVQQVRRAMQAGATRFDSQLHGRFGQPSLSAGADGHAAPLLHQRTSRGEAEALHDRT